MTAKHQMHHWINRGLIVAALASLIAFVTIRDSQWQFPLLGLAAIFIGIRLYRLSDKQGQQLSFWQSPVPWLLAIFLLFIFGIMTSGG